MDAVDGKNPYRHLFYGGAIRGGKTYVCLSLLVALAEKYPNSRWHIFRRDLPALEGTTIPSLRKIISGSQQWRWSHSRSNYHVTHAKTGSKIFFRGENLAQDPDLNDLLGLETNGILFEQIEELSEKLWQIAGSRIGSWYIDPMPVPITLATFNPTQEWIKPFIHEPYMRDELQAPYFYMTALPADNAYVTREQWENWARLDDRYKAQFIQGDWTNLADKDKLWAFAFDREKHVGRPEFDPEHSLHLSFDFNRNPICCSMIQHIDGQIRVLETIKLPTSDIYALCDRILLRYPYATYVVTGDASGTNESALTGANVHYYTAIRDKLDISVHQIKVPRSNPSLADNQMLINSLLSRYDVTIHEELAKSLIYDMEHVRREADGSIVKRNRRDPTQQADALDTFRYWCNVEMGDYLKKQQTKKPLR